ncbi:hypothetical protein GGD66_001934 [Bradyrhizobium sp. CIR48]|uniref:hypothetical protein n=1 Tax=unclassified Bradyrhizobium TaxID=2631580 RepID=UPI00181FDF92|nr:MULTISPECIES: hypothetical protein [unclassified Bradyrhizobium]MBB4377218.1 hypothetical protein [Bradyrhizobium sp. SBR1B]MBB4423394.1 hypothetical protein [Bradyrhizobium sp. CIR48]
MTATAIALQQPVSGVDAEVAVAAVRIALRHDMGFARIRVSDAELPGGIERRRGIALGDGLRLGRDRGRIVCV